MDQINANTYNEYKISDLCFHDDRIYKISSDMRVSRQNIFQRQHLTMKKMLISLCKNTSDRYHFNILIIITNIYRIYIESKLYQLEYGRIQNWGFKL